MAKFRGLSFLFFAVCFSRAFSSTEITSAAQILAPVVSSFGVASNKIDAEGFVTDYATRGNKSPEEHVGSPQIVKKTPIFDNAPFLRLKKGDNLVKGRHWNGSHKGVRENFDDNESYFLLSKGKFYVISYGIYPTFRLSDLSYSPLFDWNCTLDNAAQLYEIHLQSSRFSYSLTASQYQALRGALRKDFSALLRSMAPPTVKKPRLAGQKENRCAVFESLAFDIFTNTVFHYRVLIGPNIYAIKRKALIKGPRMVDRSEFEGISGGGINGPVPSQPDKQTAAKAIAAYRKSQAFRKVVASVLPEPQRTALLKEQNY